MEKLVVIHGALGSQKEFDAIIPSLNKNIEVIPYEIPHHGNKKDSDVDFEMSALVVDFIDFMEKFGPASIYGFSLGGYIALAAAQVNAKNIKGIITQGTKLDWTPESAKKETAGLNIDFLSTKVKGFYEYLLDLHGEYLSELLHKTTSFMTTLGANPLLTPESVKQISVPVSMTRGGRDKMVSKEETLLICENIKNSRYFEVPHMIHPLGFIKPKHISRHITIQLNSFNYKWTPTPFGEMAYEVIGDIKDENQPIVLFLHEAIGSIAQWKDFPKNLCEKLDLPGIAIEFPGYGFSEKEDKKRDAKYLHEFALEYLPAFLKSIELKNPMYIVGHSDGGTNALLYSSKFPKQVKAIVTMAAHYINEKETRAGIQPAIDAWENKKLKGLEFYHGAKTERLFFAWAKTWQQADFKNWNISEDIKGNAVPALILQGDDDQYGTDQQVNGIVELLENAEGFFIDDCGHAPHLEKEEVVIEKIMEFVGR
ncbi:hypothetical protein CW751_10165 [Brumimicrobium salinarum]|uniref:AB hydrolase-1 domain-containing protein n=1 Tax=Brumimicrobium salinarum TaxID=2058658 RepID=A0A2I0R1G9_9FLAO|nr:alpha/beta hydrolase [Brumimicrobium salinarum]PKR80423.1 hypothetical protein CW751_10165 [Brumimicrobium salinarum]